jgi:hypothetical protein
MVQVSLVGIRTNSYECIRLCLLKYNKMYPSKMKLIEMNDPELIIAKSYESIPMVLVGKNKVYFSGDNLEDGLNRLREALEERLVLTKEHNCENCGNCKCLVDTVPFETKKDSTELGKAR